MVYITIPTVHCETCYKCGKVKENPTGLYCSPCFWEIYPKFCLKLILAFGCFMAIALPLVYLYTKYFPPGWKRLKK